ncbi:DNA-processing protein DprA [Clostridium sp. 5N-1]|uniref:DNA-processing protein DprA n=1 Tax=Clostridium aquiflavi TaxID=3073603 RepID=A0ABU1EIM4_9CLOT|nr:DNA-processing protein DprA [Clostridium sp. 5N-1]
MNEEILYIWLSLIDGVGGVIGSKLLKKFNNVQSIYEAKHEQLLEIDGIGNKLAKKIINSRDLTYCQKIYDYCIENDIYILRKYKEKYPSQLNKYMNSPIVLYTKGIIKEFSKSVAIVGSRRCSEYGKKVTIELSKELSKNNIPIISGLAKGIDGYSHTVALKNNLYTVAVIGTGLDRCYPKEHMKLMEAICEQGLVISQFPPGSKNAKQNFIRRNEIIAMLCEKIVVTEAGKNSGALYTARCAMKYNKEVFAVPNNIYEGFSVGTNQLIFEGAKIYLNSKMIVFNNFAVEDDNHKLASFKMSEEEEKIYNLVKVSPATLDEIKVILGRLINNIEEVLLKMELKGYIIQKRGLFTPGV